jgi:CelD/BcsL family acetyltransferase involved in cellulose biosynthesis
MRSAEPGLALFADPADLPAGCEGLFAAGAAENVFSSRAWYRNVVRHGLPASTTACFALWSEEGRPLAIFPMQRDADGTQRSLTTPYTCLYAPLLAPEIDGAAIIRAAAAFGRFCRPAASVRLDAIAADWRGLPPLLEGVRRVGLVVQRFDHFGNWYESVSGRSWQSYLAARPGALRETVRRKLAKAERDPNTRIETIAGPDGLEDGIAAFESVYRRSWKEPEPFPAFNAGLMREMAPLGLLRLGIMRIGGEPVAVQLWVIDNGRATVLKLAHDETFKPASPGTVLTAAMLRRLLDDEGVSEIDFGRGDDPYKRQWASQRRQRIGLLLVNPLRARGLATLGRQAAGRGRRAALSLAGRLRRGADGAA